MPGYIHHIQWCVRDVKKITCQLTESYGFSLTHQRRFLNTEVPTGSTSSTPEVVLMQNVLESGDTVFILTENKARDSTELDRVKDQCRRDGHFPVITCGCASKSQHQRDTLFNVCLEVGDVDSVTERVRNTQRNGCSMVLTEPTDLNSQEGSEIRYSAVRSCCGNVLHSIIHTKLNKSSFLPGFSRVQSASHVNPVTSQMDHVTYVCRAGESKRILEWYANCFGMKRFLVNSQEAIEDNGVEIGQEVGMRMTVGEWISSWLCREEGIHFQESFDNPRNFKLVLAEPLKGRDDSHVQQFIDRHGGPGLQHIGLTVSHKLKVEDVVDAMSTQGAEFRRPPPTYYGLPEKVREIARAGGDLAKYQQLGLLLDSEADYDVIGSPSDDSGKFLIQIFTKPLFNEDTFFLEILERRGARGFGAGNITALAKSIIEYQKELLVAN